MSWMARFYVDIPTARKHKLYDCYHWHKALWTCFPNRPDSARDFLFRLEELPEGTLAHVLSEHEPVRPLYCPEENWQCKAVSSTFLEYDHYHFDVICNPGRKVKAFDSEGQPRKNSRRVAIVHPEEQREWLLRKAEQNGFALSEAVPLRIDPTQTHLFRKDQKSGTHIAVRFCGALRVVERPLFQQVFHNGLGSARAFGFGLLLLAPIHHTSM